MYSWFRIFISPVLHLHFSPKGKEYVGLYMASSNIPQKTSDFWLDLVTSSKCTKPLEFEVSLSLTVKVKNYVQTFIKLRLKFKLIKLRLKFQHLFEIMFLSKSLQTPRLVCQQVVNPIKSPEQYQITSFVSYRLSRSTTGFPTLWSCPARRSTGARASRLGREPTRILWSWTRRTDWRSIYSIWDCLGLEASLFLLVSLFIV